MTTRLLPDNLFSCADARAIDAAAIAEAHIPGIQLMKRAARAAFDLVLARWPDATQLIVLCGAGNNGGDGYLLAALAAQRKIPVQAIAVGDPQHLQGDALRAYNYARQEAVPVLPAKQLHFPLPENSLVVDAVLGTGFHGDLAEPMARLFAAVNGSALPVLAIDIPSGVSGDTGVAAEHAIRAHTTITFIVLKQGLFTAQAPSYCGDIVFADLGVPAAIVERFPSSAVRISSTNVLRERPRHAHKGEFGHLLVVGGDHGMGGAALLTAEAALRSGAGLVSLATRPEHITAALSRTPELLAMAVNCGDELAPLLQRASVVAIGPGLGRSAWSQQLLLAVLQSGKELVLDADALNLIASVPSLAIAAPNFVMTPHPGEAARLLNCSVAQVECDRFAASRRLQQRFGGVVVLKGAGTLIAHKQGLSLADVGNPGMAVAGMGDVLCGIIAALLCQGLSFEDATSTAVCAHGYAGDQAADGGYVGVRASDLMPHLRRYLNRQAARSPVGTNEA